MDLIAGWSDPWTPTLCEDQIALLLIYDHRDFITTYGDLTRDTLVHFSCRACIGQVPYRRRVQHVILCRHRHQQAIEVQQGGLHSSQPTPAGSTDKRIIRAVPDSDTSPPALVLHKTPLDFNVACGVCSPDQTSPGMPAYPASRRYSHCPIRN